MKKIWIKLVKHYQGGEKTHYMLVNESVVESKAEQDTIHGILGRAFRWRP